MARPCSICGHPDRAAIDARLMGGGSLNTVSSEFGLSRPALQRHRAAHMGSTVTLTIPASSPAAPAPISVGAHGVEALFARAAASPEHSLQEHVRLIFHELVRQLASSQGREDRAHALRVLREMRAMAQFAALVRLDNLRQAPGWAEAPTPPDAANDMMLVLMAEDGTAPLVCEAVDRLNRLHGNGFGTALLSGLSEEAGSANPSGAVPQ